MWKTHSFYSSFDKIKIANNAGLNHRNPPTYHKCNICSFQMIYLDFVQYFPEKLEEVVDLLVEKELRVRLPLEELDLLIANKENIGRSDGIDQPEEIMK